MSTVLEKKSECSGCSACANICPVNCIEMVEDEEGFLYPQIDGKRCISCGKCKRICPAVKKEEHEKGLSQAYADITLADFWGIQKVDSDMYDKMGVSLLITHSEKGQELFDCVKDELIWKREDLEEAVKHNPSYYQSYKKPKKRSEFFVRIGNEDLGDLMKRLTKDSLKRRIFNTIKQIRNIFFKLCNSS